MSEEEINKAIKKWSLYDEYYNFDTPKSTYAIFCMICFFENKNLEVFRIKNNKCERKVFKNRKQFVKSLV